MEGNRAAPEPMEIQTGPRTFTLRAHHQSMQALVKKCTDNPKTSISIVLVVVALIVGGVWIHNSKSTTTTSTTPTAPTSAPSSAPPKPVEQLELDDPPVCNGKSWPDELGAPSASPAGLDRPGHFDCNAGFRPANEIVCKGDGDFEPMPVCEQIEAYCEQFWAPSGARTDSAAALGESATVECTLGLKPKDAEVTCTSRAVFEPEPECVKIQDFCLSSNVGKKKAGKPTVSDSALGDKVKVACNDGFKPKVAEVMCGRYGAFEPSPECVQIEDTQAKEFE